MPQISFPGVVLAGTLALGVLGGLHGRGRQARPSPRSLGLNGRPGPLPGWIRPPGMRTWPIWNPWWAEASPSPRPAAAS